MSVRVNQKPIPPLPVDVLENILQYLDGKTFSRCRQVCKSWKTFIDTLTVQRTNTLWFKVCHREVSRNILADILHSNDIIAAKKTLVNWRTIYQKWFAGRLLKSKIFDHGLWDQCTDTAIMCVKISGTNIITGNSRGDICVWSMKQPQLRLQKAKCHLSQVLDIGLVDLQLLDSYHGICEGTWSHHHMITVSKDTNIRIKCLLIPLDDDSRDLVLKKHGAATTNVRVFNHHFAVCSNDNTITLWEMTMEPGSVDLKVSLLRYIRGPEDAITKIHVFEDNIICITSKNRLLLYNGILSSPKDPRYYSFLFQDKEPHFVTHPTGCYIFNNSYLFFLTSKGKLYVSVDPHTMHNYRLMPTLRTEITCIDLKGNVLALGGINGRLFVYYFTDLKTDFPKLAEPDIKVQLSPASITNLDISYEPRGVVVAAATAESLYLVWCGDKT